MRTRESPDNLGDRTLHRKVLGDLIDRLQAELATTSEKIADLEAETTEHRARSRELQLRLSSFIAQYRELGGTSESAVVPLRSPTSADLSGMSKSSAIVEVLARAEKPMHRHSIMKALLDGGIGDATLVKVSGSLGQLKKRGVVESPQRGVWTIAAPA